MGKNINMFDFQGGAGGVVSGELTKGRIFKREVRTRNLHDMVFEDGLHHRAAPSTSEDAQQVQSTV